MEFYRKVDAKVGTVFESYGRMICRNPVSAIILSVFLNGLLGINILIMKTETDMDTLYTPTNSQADNDMEQVKMLFPEKDNENFFYHHLPDMGHYGSVIFYTDDNIINETYKSEIKLFHDSVKNIKINSSDGQIFSYEDLCGLNNGRCYAWGLWYLSDEFWIRYRENTLEYPLTTDKIRKFHNTEREFGNVQVKDGKLKEAKALRFRYYLRQHNEQFKNLAAKWEQAFLETMLHHQMKKLKFTLCNSNSLKTELNQNTKGDVPLFSLTFTLMITYASLVCAGGNCLTQRGNLGRAGVISTALAILGAFGFCAAVRIKYVNMVGIMPFLILGIGVDDMFILMSGLTDAPLKGTVEERIGYTMKTSGVAITITTLTDLIAFMAGYLSDFLSVRLFCLFTGSAVILCYFNQITFFLGCLVLHERRVAARRHCLTCKPIYESEEVLAAGHTNPLFLKFCSGKPAETKNDLKSKLEKVPSMVLSRLVLNGPIKLGILLTYLCYLGISIYSTLHLEQGLEVRNLVSQNSYYHGYSMIEYDNFPTKMSISFILNRPLHYTNIKVVNNINELIRRAQTSKYIDNKVQLSWLKEYYNSILVDNKTEYEFCNKLRFFFKFAPVFKSDVVFSKNGSLITHSRIFVITKNIKRSYDQGQMMLDMRKVADDSNLPVFAFGQAFKYFEQYVAVLPNTLMTVGVATSACFFVTSLFMPHPLIILLVSLSTASIIVGVFGFMQIWGLSLSSITMIHVIMSVGFSVDFSTHICHAYMILDGFDRNAKTSAALRRAGSPIFNCAMSSILGVCTLIFSDSFVFRSFFKVMFLVICFAFFHGVFILPVILSTIGPIKKLETKKSKPIDIIRKRPSATWSISGNILALDTDI